MTEAQPMVEIHLGIPYAPPGAKCIYCGKPGTRSAKMPGSMTLPSGEKISFTDQDAVISFCDDHGVLHKPINTE